MGIVNPYLAQNSLARSEGRECLILAPPPDSSTVVSIYINISGASERDRASRNDKCAYGRNRERIHCSHSPQGGMS